ncbi:MAG: hypothetical protein WA215_12410 [Candidatus Cybelea sp.]
MKDCEMVAKGEPTSAEPAWPPGDVPNPTYSGAQPSNGHSNGVVKPATPPDPHDASPTSGTGAAAIRDELGNGSPGDKRTMAADRRPAVSDAAFREECRRRGVVVISP